MQESETKRNGVPPEAIPPDAEPARDGESDVERATAGREQAGAQRQRSGTSVPRERPDLDGVERE